MRYVIGVDIGTSGTKAILVDENGNVCRDASRSYDFVSVRDGWTEQDPALWWDAVVYTIQRVVTQVDKKDIIAISMSGQMHSTVMLDKEGIVIRPAILWNDTRTSAQCKLIEELVQGKEQLLKETANPALEGFSAPKILWVKEHEPQHYERIHKVLMPKDYIGYRLSGKLYTEKSDASGTLLMDVKQGQWNYRLIETLGLSKNIVPDIYESSDVIGTLTEEAAQLLRLDTHTVVVAGGADNACAALGCGILHEHDALISIGTSGTIMIHEGERDVKVDGTYHLFSHCYQHDRYAMSVMLSSGLSFKWLHKELLKTESDYDALCNDAAHSCPGSHGVCFLPYLCGERSPHPDADVRASFSGIQASTTQEDMIRSVLEGVGYGCRECLEVMDQEHSIRRLKITGGGARSRIWTQIIADITGCELEIVDVKEGPAYGAALLAGLGSGVFHDIKAICDCHGSVNDICYPNMENKKIYDANYKIYRQLYTALKPVYQNMKNIK